MLKCLKEWLAIMTDSGEPNGLLNPGDHIDAVALREEGDVELIIIARGRLDGSERTQGLLQIKIKQYLQQRSSIAFNAEFQHPPADKVHIVLECDRPPAPAIRSLFRRLEPMVQARQAQLMIRCQAARVRYLNRQLNRQYPLILPHSGHGPDHHRQPPYV